MMVKEVEALVDKITDKVMMCEEVCKIREFAGEWGCSIGNCDKCTGLAIEMIYQKWNRDKQSQLLSGMIGGKRK